MKAAKTITHSLAQRLSEKPGWRGGQVW